jgi:MOSC domain-containing protein YiiM
VTTDGLQGDGHAHAKHNRPERAVSLFDLEILTQLQLEGFPLYPGAIGENLTVAGLHVQRLPPGTLLEIGEVLLRLEEPRKPCYVLDAISPCLKDVIVGRCGYMASVLEGGMIRPSMEIVIASEGQESPTSPLRTNARRSSVPGHRGNTIVWLNMGRVSTDFHGA